MNNQSQSTLTIPTQQSQLIQIVSQTKSNLIYNAVKRSNKQLIHNYENDIFAIPSRRLPTKKDGHSSESSTVADINDSTTEEIESGFNSNLRQCNSPFQDMDFDEVCSQAYSSMANLETQNYTFEKPSIKRQFTKSDKEINYNCLIKSTETVSNESKSDKGNNLIMSRIAEFKMLISRHLTIEANEEFYNLANKMCQYVEYLGSDLKGVASTSIVHSILILVASKVGISKKTFLKVLNTERRKNTNIRIDVIKKSQCYNNMKRGFVEILRQC